MGHIWGGWGGGFTRKCAPYVGDLAQSDSSCQSQSIHGYTGFVARTPRDAPDAFFLDGVSGSGYSNRRSVENGRSRQDHFGITG